MIEDNSLSSRMMVKITTVQIILKRTILMNNNKDKYK